MDIQTDERRFHHLDALRASALLIGILLHAIMSFLPGYREAGWPISDASTSTGLGIVYYVIHLFRMPLFFLLAGFFARLLHQKLGTRGLLRNRLRRIALPLVAFYFVVMPSIVVAMVWGARQLDIKAAGKVEYPMPIIGPPVPWGHLWFLYMLLVIYLVVVLLRAAVARFDTGGTLRSAAGRLADLSFRTRLAPLILALPIGASLHGAPWWVQWQGIPSPIAGLVPNVPSMLAYGGAFLAGWFLHRRQDTLELLARDWPLYGAGALLGIAGALAIAGATPKLAVLPLGATGQALYLAAYLGGMWCATFCAIGVAQRCFAAPSARWRYLADASYWMYLMHLPVVFLLQAWMLTWPLHWSAKLALILAITAALLVGSYHFLVRRTFMGVFLNGRKYPATARVAPVNPAGQVPGA
ncbi:acyltransferase family protein [Pseudoduganella sp. SL102]|uniref:acyltransferase family protein n=1 Tax=Pseudoduganella sp. SL102 TaxID=2995154 RepID=UPI00248AAA84|nr:acyltransferase family protein [Pseudoduganella sp. SL102]WBS01118.1 acyltransferase family protein [Pseudoduganella sp. SL102]